MKNKELVSEIVQTILKTTKELTTEKGSPDCRFGPFSFPLNGRGALPTAGVAVNLTLAVTICWDENQKCWRQGFQPPVPWRQGYRHQVCRPQLQHLPCGVHSVRG